MRLPFYLSTLICFVLNAGLSAQTIQTIAGKGTLAYNGDGGPAIRASFYDPLNLAWNDKTKTLYISDFYNRRIRIIDSNGVIHSHDSIIQYPNGLALDKNGELYVAVSSERYVYKLPKAGGKIIIAGTGATGFGGDGGPATSAKITPTGLAFDAAGNLYIADNGNGRIRKVDTNGIITTVAGNGGASYNGDGIAATAATLNAPVEVAIEKNGSLLILERSGYRIRRVSTSGIISTVAGKGAFGYSGDGGRADSALIGAPRSFVLDSTGNIYFSDASNECIRQVDNSGIIHTVAGTDSSGFYGDGSSPSAALFFEPAGLAICRDQSLLIADCYNHRIRKICPATTVQPAFSIQMTHSSAGAPYDRITFTPTFTPYNAGQLYKWRVNGGLVSTDSVFSYAGLAIGTMVTVEVIAYNLCYPQYFDTVYVTSGTTGVPAGRQTSLVSVYPNPATTNLIVKTGNISTDCYMILTDALLRVVFRKTLLPNSNNPANISKLDAGTYYLCIRDSSGVRQVIPITKL